AGIDTDQLAVALKPDEGIKRVLLQLVDHHFLDARIQPEQEALDEIVRHRALRGYLFNLEGNGIGLVNSNPDGQDAAAAHILKNYDRHIRDRIHHQAANFHLEFHWRPLITLHHTHRTLSHKGIRTRACHSHR